MKKFPILLALIAALSVESVQSAPLVIVGAGPASSSAMDGATGYSVEGELAWAWTDNIDRSSIGLSFGYAGGFEGGGNIWGAGDDATGSMSVFTVAPRVGMAFPVTERIGFYIQGQAGVSRVDVKASGLYDRYPSTQTINGSDWEFSWGLGAGLDFNIRKGHSLRVGYSLLGMSNFNVGNDVEIAPEYLHGLIIAYSIQF